MTSKEVREKYINFFKISPRSHVEISPAPLVLENDFTTLFTSSGMQPLIPYLMGEPHQSGGKRLVDSQPSLRLQDIDEVGDNRHTTFFEMLGNWSLGDYFKEDQLPWVYEFLTKELGLPEERLWVSVFEGNNQVPKDIESAEIWKKIGIPENKIIYYGVKNNWWSRSGTPEEMPIGEIGGPDSEIFYDFDPEGKLKIHDSSLYKNEKCNPNCECGRFLEIGNSVFIQYKKIGENKLEELPNKNVDFGGGLERITASANNNPDIFRTDVFSNVVSKIIETLEINKGYGEDELIDESVRIIADHLRASVMLISSGVMPGNKAQGYVLRKLIRRSVLHARFINKSGKLKLPEVDFSDKGIPLSLKPVSEINAVIREESQKFALALDKGMKSLLQETAKGNKITADFTFDLYQTDGFPLELTAEILRKQGNPLSQKDIDEFNKKFEGHKELSRTTSAGIFKGGLADHSPEVIKLHTATHILLASLRKVLGEHVVQRGQNITKERIRFDFPNPEKPTEDQIKKVEDLINEVIKKDLPVSFKIMPKEDAIKTGAIHAFNEKYTDTVKVYYVGDSLEEAISKEFCGGPHVTHTGEIGRVKIKKLEKIGSGLMRIYITIG